MSRNYHQYQRHMKVDIVDNSYHKRGRNYSPEDQYYRARNGSKRYPVKEYIQIDSHQSEESESGVIKFGDDKSQNVVVEKQAVPWMSKTTKSINDTLLRFHNEIIEFYNYVKPSKKSHQSRVHKFTYLKQKILQTLPTCQIIPFGSFATELYLPDGDIDIAVLTHGTVDIGDAYNRVYRMLGKDGAFREIQYIRKSKVPLIKFKYQGIQVDISVDKTDGIEQLKYVEKIINVYPEFKYLVFVFKCTFRIRGMSETYSGGIGSFLLSCMILVYLQAMHEKKNYYTLAEHVIEFMKFFALRDDDYWGRKVLYVRTGKIMDRRYDQAYFSCMSPQDQTHDIGKSAFKIRQVFKVLKNRCNYILDNNFEFGQSVLRVLVNPSEQIFRYLKANESKD